MKQLHEVKEYHDAALGWLAKRAGNEQFECYYEFPHRYYVDSDGVVFIHHCSLEDEGRNADGRIEKYVPCDMLDIKCELLPGHRIDHTAPYVCGCGNESWLYKQDECYDGTIVCTVCGNTVMV
jgi:hypothetical protein